MDRRSRQNYPSRQTRAPSVRFHPLAWQAFDCAVPFASLPTFPRYMTSRVQYLLGSFIFVLFACGIFLLLVHENRQVIMLAPLVPAIPEAILQAVKAQSAPYLIVVVGMGFVYLYLLTKEAEWNVLLMIRDVIRIWISVPQLAKQIITQIRASLRVPEEAVPKVIESAPEVVEADFQKGPSTPDLGGDLLHELVAEATPRSRNGRNFFYRG
jgi:hypothetical protein